MNKPRPDAFLTPREVVMIRQIAAEETHTLEQIAAMFRVSRGLVSQIRDRRIWKWL